MAQNIYQNRYEHLLALIDRHGGQTAVAEKLGLSKQYVHLVSLKDPKRVKSIGHKMARKIEGAFGMPIGSLDDPIGVSAAQQDAASIEIPSLALVLTVGASAERDDMVHGLRMSKRWIRLNTEATAFELLARVEMPGDNMEPTLLSGSTLLIDTAIRKIEGAAVYVLVRDAELFVRRVQKNLDGSYAVTSDNPAYQPEAVADPIRTGIIVCGRVVAALNPRKI